MRSVSARFDCRNVFSYIQPDLANPDGTVRFVKARARHVPERSRPGKAGNTIVIDNDVAWFNDPLRRDLLATRRIFLGRKTKASRARLTILNYDGNIIQCTGLLRASQICARSKYRVGNIRRATSAFANDRSGGSRDKSYHRKWIIIAKKRIFFVIRNQP